MSQKIKDFDILDVRVGVFNIRNLKHVDWMISATVLALAVIGLALLYSADRSIESSIPYWYKQSLFLMLGIGLALTLLCIDSRFLVSIAPILYVGAIILLLLVIVAGAKAKGGQRWLALGPLRIQPSEQTKLIVILGLTWYLTLIKDRIKHFPYLILAFIIAGVPAVLILKQPSLGTAMAIMPITLVMVFVAGCRWWHLAALLLASLIAIVPVYNHLEDYQRTRVNAFLGISEPEEPDINDKAADTEPSVDPESSADKETSADKEPSVDEGPSVEGGQTPEEELKILPDKKEKKKDHHVEWKFIWQKLRSMIPLGNNGSPGTEEQRSNEKASAAKAPVDPKTTQENEKKAEVNSKDTPGKKKEKSPELTTLWQTLQSMITIGSGGLTGKGYLKGTQTMLNYLPEHHTDFIFSVLAEEEGLAGAIVVLGLYAAFLLRGLKISLESNDMLGALLASGIVTMFAFHIYVNIAITIGLMPVTGIPLPFLSYGGSFYITSMMGVGILLNVPVRKQLFD